MNYYVYLYFDQSIPGNWRYKTHTFAFEPFYVGKGTRSRDTAHLLPSVLGIKSAKSSRIKSIISKTGELPLHKRLFEGLTQDEAIKIEIDIIRHFGRRDLKTGILCNHTDGGEGANNFSEETKRKIGNCRKKHIYQYGLDGIFIRKWESATSVRDTLNINTANIPTAAKRNGTCEGFIWSYVDRGMQIIPKVRWQSPIKYTNIKQIDINGNTIRTFDTALDIEKALNLVAGGRNQIYTAIKNQTMSSGYYWKV